MKNDDEDGLKVKHCQNCGKQNPPIIGYGDGSHDGYTECCNESVCEGKEFFVFSDDKESVQACCWAVAELKFKERGIDIAKLGGMRRTKIDS